MWGEFTGGKRIFNPPSPVLKAGTPFVPYLGYTALYVFLVLGFSCVVDVYIFCFFFYIYQERMSPAKRGEGASN